MKRFNWKKILISVGVVLIILYVVLAVLTPPAGPHPFFRADEKGPLVIAHRGGRGLWPENTLLAFKLASTIGVDTLEMDMRQTADGVLVIIHDATVDRTTNGKGEVSDLSLAELQSLDAGYYWSDDDGASYPYRGQGIKIPTLEEVFLNFPDMRMMIEIKENEPSVVGAICSLIRSYEMTTMVLVASFHDEVIKSFRQECPEVATSASEAELRTFFILNTLLLDRIFRPEMQAFQAPEYSSGLHVLTRRFVANAHRRNVQVHPWTINDTYGMQRMLALGVDGIITDYPDLLLALLGR